MKINNNKNEESKLDRYYSTSDISLITVISLWHSIESIDRTNPNRAVFCFKKTTKLCDLVDKYWNGQLKVDPKVYFGQLKLIKSRLYEEK